MEEPRWEYNKKTHTYFCSHCHFEVAKPQRECPLCGLHMKENE